MQKRPRDIAGFSAAALIALMLSLPSFAADGAASNADFKKEDAIVVELFTSQGCSSCPPAEAFMRELSAREDVLTLEYHVDYWNDLLTFSGRWQDPYSKREWSQRQLAYNRALEDSERVFTPQAVVDGRFQGIGSRQSAIRDFIAQAQTTRARNILLEPKLDRAGKVTVRVDGPAPAHPVSVVLVRFLHQTETKVTAGENKGDTLVSFNIVTSLMPLASWQGGPQDIEAQVPPVPPEESCAVLLQDPENMRILSARFCRL